MPLDLAAATAVSHRPHPHRIGPIPVRCGGYSRWFVLCARPASEAWADANVTEAGYVSFLPTIAVTRTQRGQRVTRTTPLFVGYLFVALDLAIDPWIPVTHLPGVRGFLHDGTLKPVPCPAGAVEALQAGEERRRSPTPPSALLRPLDAVSVAHGPFRRHTGQIVGINRDRAVVTLMLFGRLQDVHVAVADLVSAGENA
jgi:transcriptional antiterminator RfaH